MQASQDLLRNHQNIENSFFKRYFSFLKHQILRKIFMVCCFLKFYLNIFDKHEWINDGISKCLPFVTVTDSKCRKNFLEVVWFWCLINSRPVTNHKIPPWKFLEISEVYKDLFWCVICGTFKLLSQNLLVNKHKLQISKLLKINQVPSNLVQNKFQKCCQK